MNGIPLNAEAELVTRLTVINKDIDSQILELAKVQAANAIIIENARPAAQWGTEPSVQESLAIAEAPSV